jgi:hypothetical protein
VTFPGKAELMEVGLTSVDSEAAAILVREVVEAYLREVVNAELDQKRQRLSELDRAFAEKEQEIRSRRETLKKLASELGTSATEALTLKQKLALEELSLYRQELWKLQAELRVHERDLAVQKALLQLTLKGSMERDTTLQDIKRLETQIAVETEQKKDLEKAVQQKRSEAERFGVSTVDMEMLLADIKNAEIVLNALASERDKLKVENRAVPRISLIQQAQKPDMPDDSR